MNCEKCGSDKISEKIADYSKSHFEGKILCYGCQQEIKDKKVFQKTEVAEPKNSNTLDREKLIIRQACVKAACELLANDQCSGEKVISYATEFEKWILR